MNTLHRFSHGDASVPGSTSWYLADLGEFRGQQILYTRQAPQRLKTLREHALIESAVSSNRIEGVGDEHAPRGSKTEQVLAAIQRLPPESTLAQLEQACPGVSRDMVRRVLGAQRGQSVECIGRGPGAKWIRLGGEKG